MSKKPNSIISYLWDMVRKKKEAKKPPKTMEEVSKNFEEFMKGKETNPETEQDFEKLVKKAIKKKHRPAKH